MTDNYEYIDVNDEQWDGTPRALRDALDKAQKALKTERQATAELRNQTASTALSGVLAGFKNPERVKTAILGDKVDPLNSEAVTAWLESNGDDYAKGTPADPSTDDTQTSQAAAPQASTPNYQQLNGLAEIGTPAGANALQEIQAMPEGLGPKDAYAWLAARAK